MPSLAMILSSLASIADRRASTPLSTPFVAEALQAEKSKRYGTSLAGLFSEEDRARAGASIKAALADEAEPPG